MTYSEPNLVTDSAGGYSSINCKQRYDAIATVMTANGNWTLVDTVDYVSSPNTYRRFVWKCATPGNGLAADFYLVFECAFITATGLWVQGTASGSAPWVSMGEAYNSTTKVLSKHATNVSTAAAIASDMTHPGTWTLTAIRTLAMAASPHLSSAMTSEKMCILVTGGTIVIFTGTGANTGIEFYAGVFDSVMTTTDDPMPIFLGAGPSTQGNMSSGSQGSTTRSPKLVSGTSYGYLNMHTWQSAHYAGSSQLRMDQGAYSTIDTQGGTLGDPSSTSWHLYLGGVRTTRVCLATSGVGLTGSTRGGLRGFLRHIAIANGIAHATGDVFTIDGKAHAGRGGALGAAPFLDKTAT